MCAAPIALHAIVEVQKIDWAFLSFSDATDLRVGYDPHLPHIILEVSV